jgi:hypothetical protein
MPDVIASSSEAVEEKAKSSQVSSEAATETAGADDADEKLGSKAEQRIRQLVSQNKEIRSVAEWYRDNVGTPDDVLEFRDWKKQQVANAVKAEESGQISEAQLKQVKELMRKADPEIEAIKESLKQEQKDRADAMLSAAEDEIRDLCKGIGFDKKGDEAKINFIARQISLVIKDDERLFKMWRAGDVRCVKKAFQEVNDNFITPLRGTKSTTQNLSQNAGEKRRIAKLPSASQGSPALSQKSTTREKGINKDTHNDAWELLQSYRQQD